MYTHVCGAWIHVHTPSWGVMMENWRPNPLFMPFIILLEQWYSFTQCVNNHYRPQGLWETNNDRFLSFRQSLPLDRVKERERHATKKPRKMTTQEINTGKKDRENILSKQLCLGKDSGNMFALAVSTDSQLSWGFLVVHSQPCELLSFCQMSS